MNKISCANDVCDKPYASHMYTLGHVTNRLFPVTCDDAHSTFCSAWLVRQVKNPATGEVIATVPCMKANETSAAVAEATSAWPEWSKMVAKERSKIMRKYVLVSAAYTFTMLSTHQQRWFEAQNAGLLSLCTRNH